MGNRGLGVECMKILGMNKKSRVKVIYSMKIYWEMGNLGKI